jgi:hypothetical protein
MRTAASSPLAGDIRAIHATHRHGAATTRDVLGLARRLLALAQEPGHPDGGLRSLINHLCRTRRADLAALAVALGLSADAKAVGFGVREVLASLLEKEVQDRLADHDTRSRPCQLNYMCFVMGSRSSPLLPMFEADGSCVLSSAGHAASAAHFGSDPRILLSSFYRPMPAGAPATADRATFLRRWSALTSGLLDGWDWSATVAVGGAVTHCLCPDEDGARPRPPDVDLFFLGGAASVVKWVKLLCAHMVERVGAGNVGVVVSSTAVSILFADPTLLRVQAALGHWRCVADVLQTTDLDCTSAGYVGDGRVVCTGRGALAWVHRLNTPSATQHSVRSSPEYELRLWKYAVRFGFAMFSKRTRRAAVPTPATGEFDKACGLEWMTLVDDGAIIPELRPDRLAVTAELSLTEVLHDVKNGASSVGDGYGGRAWCSAWGPSDLGLDGTACLDGIARCVPTQHVMRVDPDEWQPLISTSW